MLRQHKAEMVQPAIPSSTLKFEKKFNFLIKPFTIPPL